MPIENDKGPGGVDAAYGKRTTLPARNYDVTKKYGDTFREDGDGPVNHIIKEDENGNVGIGTAAPIYDLQVGEYGVSTDSTLALATTNTGTGTIRFGDGTSGPNANSGRIQYDHATDNMNFWTNSSERMRIASSGNVGIGLSNPATPLGLADGAQISWGASNYAYVAGSNTANVLTFGTQGTERMRINASGNVGVGTTPSSWSTGKALELGTAGNSLWGYSGNLILSQNTAGYSTDFLYASTAAATRYQQTAGQHQWHVAPSGTAGNTINFTQAMTLDNSGNLGLSVTPSNWVGYKAFEFGPGNALWGSNTNSSFLSTNLYWDGAFKYKGAFPASYYQQSAGEHRWFTAPTGTANAAATVTQRMTLDVNGRLKVGTSSNPVSSLIRMLVQGDGTNGGAVELVANGGGGVVFDPISGGGVTISRFTGAVGAESYTSSATIDASGNLGLGVTPSAWGTNFRGLQVGGVGSVSYDNNFGQVYLGTNFYMAGSGGGTPTYLTTNAAARLDVTQSGFAFKQAASGTAGTTITWSTPLTIDSTGNVLVTGSGGLGYGTGSGGTVTQLTSKTTGVTINKANGHITMNNAALASGATAAFLVTNSVMTANDNVIVNLAGGNAGTGTYRVWAEGTGLGGQFYIVVENRSGGSLSEALVLHFAIIKGATS